MQKSFITNYILFVCFVLSFVLTKTIHAGDREVNDFTFKFTITLPQDWDSKDLKETTDKDGISYSFERKDKKMTMMLLAFKLTSVKNLEDFIYNMEKDISLNIPPKNGDYESKDYGKYDMKSGVYKDNNFYEKIYFYRTKMPDATNNFVYMIRFITTPPEENNDNEIKINSIMDTFKSTIE